MQYRDAIGYARCMRSHGVANFPDPQSGPAGAGFAFKVPNGRQIGSQPGTFQHAQQQCRHLLPDGAPSVAQRQQFATAALAFARCMRTHGMPDLPEPVIYPNAVRFGGPRSGVDSSSPTFQSAAKTCRKLLPGGGDQRVP